MRGERSDVAGVVVELAELVDDGRTGTDGFARGFDVLEVLATRRVRAVSGRDECERALDAVVSHLAHRVGQIGVPVAIAPVDGQRVAGPRELGVEGGDEGAVLRVDRAHSPEPLVLLGHHLQSLGRHVAPTGHVLEEGEDVVGALWPTERHHDHGVVRLGHGLSVADGVLTSCQEMPTETGVARMLHAGPKTQERTISARRPPSRLAALRANPLPEGTITVGTGLVIAGIASYLFLAISARALGPDAFAPLSVMWVITFLAGPGFFLPVEQEVTRALAHRRAEGMGGGPVIVRAAQLGGILAAILVVITLIVSPWMVSHLFDGYWLLLVGFLLGLVGYYAGHLGRGTFSGMGRFGALRPLHGG